MTVLAWAQEAAVSHPGKVHEPLHVRCLCAVGLAMGMKEDLEQKWFDSCGGQASLPIPQHHHKSVREIIGLEIVCDDLQIVEQKPWGCCRVRTRDNQPF